MSKEIRNILIAASVLLAILAFMFRGGFKEGATLFSNDGPMGVINAGWYNVDPGLARWQDTHWLGANISPQPVSISEFVHLLFRRPILFFEPVMCGLATFLFWLISARLHRYTEDNRRMLIGTVVWALLAYQAAVFGFRALIFIVYAG